MPDRLSSDALAYHRFPVPGKLAISATKPLASQHDLSLAYSPGVAAACDAIAADPAEAANLTARSNLVAVVTNGTAVLGLGSIGPLAAKPVMEGKAVLFKKFSGIDVFDVEIDEQDPERFCDVVASLEPTFGGINLEDVKAPECFEIESRLRERMNIPVFHDDQHGTAIIVGAAVRNALELVGKSIGEVRLVASGAGAAALACLDLLLGMGLKRENVVVTDVAGVVHAGREELMDRWKARYAVETDARTLAEVIGGADVFLGLSAPGVLEPEHVRRMAKDPLILALANPVPEILPEAAREARRGAIVATGRADGPIVIGALRARGHADDHGARHREHDRARGRAGGCGRWSFLAGMNSGNTPIPGSAPATTGAARPSCTVRLPGAGRTRRDADVEDLPESCNGRDRGRGPRRRTRLRRHVP